VERTVRAADAAHVTLVTPKQGQSIEPSVAHSVDPWWPKVPWQTAAQHPIVSTHTDSRQRPPGIPQQKALCWVTSRARTFNISIVEDRPRHATHRASFVSSKRCPCSSVSDSTHGSGGRSRLQWHTTGRVG
jgi:hypothetical protein